MIDPATLPLKDIHLPAAPGWWPPAPGWWCLLGLVMLLAVAWLYWRRRKVGRYQSAIKLARQELYAIQARYQNEQDAQSAVQAVSVLLRRLSISLFPRRGIAGLTGKDWLRFLDEQLAQAVFCEGAGQIMLEAPYNKQVPGEQADALLRLCRQWIEAVAARRGRA